MDGREGQIGPLKRVRLSCRTSAEPLPKELDFREPNMEFIFGIGPDGLSPIERGIAGKTVGEILSFSLSPQSFEELFGHLPAPGMESAASSSATFLHVKILGVESPDQREVIKALAELANREEPCCCH